MIRIKIEGKNIADLWRLECVKSIKKEPKGNIIVMVSKTNDIGKTYLTYGMVGDTIEVESEQSKTGMIIFREP